MNMTSVERGGRYPMNNLVQICLAPALPFSGSQNGQRAGDPKPYALKLKGLNLIRITPTPEALKAGNKQT